jgi:tetratricopeptide (TPR) repeat protein
MWKIIMCVAVLVLINCSEGARAAAPVQVKTTSEDYLACATLAKKDSEKALDMAAKWVKSNPNDLSALHCKSIALFALKRYAQAAVSLDAMWGVLKDSDAYTLQLNVLRQSARAFKLAGNRDELLKRYALAMGVMAEGDGGEGSYAKTAAVEVLLDRSAFFQSEGAWLAALQDMDYAVSYDVMLDKVLFARAKIYIALSQRELAENDLNALLAQNPSNADAQSLLKSLSK